MISTARNGAVGYEPTACPPVDIRAQLPVYSVSETSLENRSLFSDQRLAPMAEQQHTTKCRDSMH